MATAADIPLLVASANSSSERRITPAWTVAQFKARLEPITGIPASAQKLTLRIGSQDPIAIEAVDDEATQLASFPLQAYAEIYVHDARPSSARENFTDVSSVPKYVMPTSTYETRTDSVLAWKKAQKLGRFDPHAPDIENQKIQHLEREVSERGIAVGKRCQLLPANDGRRGTVAYVGDVEGIPGVGAWVGVALDEPTGRNDGSVGGKRYFECKGNCGVFVRPERVEVGEFEVLDELGEEMEEM